MHELSKSQDEIPKKTKLKAQIPLSEPEASLSDYSLDSDVEFDSDLLSDHDDDHSEGSISSDQHAEDTSDSRIGLDQEDASSTVDEESAPPERRKRRHTEVEAEYEVSGRPRWTAPARKSDTNTVEIARLPIKLQNGEVQQMEGRIAVSSLQTKEETSILESDSDEEEIIGEEQEDSDDGVHAQAMAGQRGKFGRIGVAEIVGTPGWDHSRRLEAAKEQIAAIGAEILAGGELADTVSWSRWLKYPSDVQNFQGSTAHSIVNFCPAYGPLSAS